MSLTSYSALALDIAKRAHEGQVRTKGKQKDQPYITHPQEVASRVHRFLLDVQGRQDPEMRNRIIIKDSFVYHGWSADMYAAVSYLHDVVEDTKWTLESLLEEYYKRAMEFYENKDCQKVSDAEKHVRDWYTIVNGVRGLTRDKNESYYNFIVRVAAVPQLRVIKYFDIEHNMSDLEPGSLKDKYTFAQKYIEAEMRK